MFPKIFRGPCHHGIMLNKDTNARSIRVTIIKGVDCS